MNIKKNTYPKNPTPKLNVNIIFYLTLRLIQSRYLMLSTFLIHNGSQNVFGTFNEMIKVSIIQHLFHNLFDHVRLCIIFRNKSYIVTVQEKKFMVIFVYMLQIPQKGIKDLKLQICLLFSFQNIVISDSTVNMIAKMGEIAIIQT